MAGLNILLIASIFLGTVAIALRPKPSTCANELCTNNGECKITSNNGYKCLCRSGFTGANCQMMTRTTKALQDRNLTITVKSTLYDLYIDGTKQNTTYRTNWTYPDTIPLAPLNRLICAMAIDSTETCAGLIASATGDYLVTDGINWRCSYIAHPQWYLLGWDDSVWDLAYVVGPNHNVTWPPLCEILTGIPSISPAANWIWTNRIADAPYYHSTVYCRGYLPLCEHDSPCLNGGSCNRNNESLCSCLLGFTGEFCETEILENATLSRDDVNGVQNLGAHDDISPIPAPNAVPPHSAGKDNDPSLPHPALQHAPIERSDGTESRNNVRQAIRKQHIG